MFRTMHILVMRFILQLLLLIHSQSVEAKRIVALFHPGILRVHDNPVLRQIHLKYKETDRQSIDSMLANTNTEASSDILPIIYMPKEEIPASLSAEGIVADIRSSYQRLHPSSPPLPLYSTAEALLSALRSIDEVFLCDDSGYPAIYQLMRTLNDNGIATVACSDKLPIADYPGRHILEYIFPSFESSYEACVESMAADMKNRSQQYLSLVSADNDDTGKHGESLARQLVSDWRVMPEEAFVAKYSRTLIHSQCTSAEHTLSLIRLNESMSFFRGEVYSRIISPLAALGCISPTALVLPSAYETDLLSWLTLQPSKQVIMKNDAIRRDWFRRISRAKTTSKWIDEYRYWQGYLQREAYYVSNSARNTSGGLVFVLLHGFGGSADQMEALAGRLGTSAVVTAFDLVGFGRSEKPSISYNQYLWRDQTVDFVNSVREKYGADKRIILAGNSIGGFIMTSAAAALSASGVHCAGLILVNSAGGIIEGAGLRPDETPQFSAYKGPSAFALRAIGALFVAGLRPAIRNTLVWLYPSNPSPANGPLTDFIGRDAVDPVASDVVGAGGKLPPPLSMNHLLSRYMGAVLVCQGALDPLNDSAARARMLQGIREGVSVEMLPLGHCPMDEDPDAVAAAIHKWLLTL